MKKFLLFLFFTLFSFSAIHAQITSTLSDDGTLTISGTGDMPNYSDLKNRPWHYAQDKIKKVIIEEGVTRIGDGAFTDCHNLTSVEIPNSVTSIGAYAFYCCEGLTSITIPNSVTSIGEQAFNLCSSLTSVTIPNSVKSIGRLAFVSCLRLAYITFKGSTPPELGFRAFNQTQKISVYVPTNRVEAYKKELEGWGFSNIQADPKLLCLADDEAYTRDSETDGMDISYTRNFTNTKWQALYLPFSLKYDDWKDDFEVARINGIHQYDDNDDGNIDRTILEFVKMNSGSTAPNTPYIIRAKKKGEKTFYVENTTVYPAEKNAVDCSTTAANFIFTGTYIPARFLASRPYYTLSGGKLERLDGLNGPSVPPYHWYMKIESRNSGYAKYYNPAKEITISVLGEEEATGISQMQMENRQSSVYDINGRKVNENSLKPGMYVKNGRKFVIK